MAVHVDTRNLRGIIAIQRTYTDTIKNRSHIYYIEIRTSCTYLQRGVDYILRNVGGQNRTIPWNTVDF